MSDRTIHGISQSGGEIVRYDRGGKWWLEYEDSALPITVADAALFATVDGAEAFTGKPGGGAFDAKVAATQRKEDSDG